MAVPQDDVTALLIASSHGNREMLDRLTAAIYEDLRALARARLRGERRHHTIDTVALVHEAYLKLVGIDRIAWQDRTHFFATASRLMRRILVDHAHRRHTAKRGGGAVHEDAAEIGAPAGGNARRRDTGARPGPHPPGIPERTGGTGDRMLALRRALDRRDRGGVGVSPATAKRDLCFGQACLARMLRP